LYRGKKMPHSIVCASALLAPHRFLNDDCLLAHGRLYRRVQDGRCLPRLVRDRLPAVALFAAIIFGLASEIAAREEGLFKQETLTGDWGGSRKALNDAGIDFNANDTSEMLSNPVGGIKQTTVYQGLLTTKLTLDFEKLANWPGASFYTEAYWISGRGLSRSALGNLLVVSNIEALASTRLNDLWLQQEILDRQLSLRIGQIAIDDEGEFYYSQYGLNFINSTFGCPDILSTDLPAGGPCYPFAVPGVRLRVGAPTALHLSGAVFNGTPAPPGLGDPQVRNPHGTNFLIGLGGLLAMAELAYPFDMQPESQAQLSDIKLGGWYHTADFPDLRRDTSGRSLADPTSDGIATTHRGSFGLYLIVDKMLWEPADAGARGLAGFLRVGGTAGDRNLINLEVDAGLTYKGLFSGRESDLLGIAASYGRIGGGARALSRDAVLFTGVRQPIRDYEGVLELTYQLSVAPWWVLQPDLQAIFHPGGRIAAPPPAPLGTPIPNALVLGLRSTITF
jgi:porin